MKTITIIKTPEHKGIDIIIGTRGCEYFVLTSDGIIIYNTNEMYEIYNMMELAGDIADFEDMTDQEAEYNDYFNKF